MNDSINALDLPELDEVLDFDAGADAFAGGEPVHDGEYHVRLLPDEQEPSVKKTPEGIPYISIPFVAQIVDPNGPLDNRRVWGKVSTRIGKTRTSRAIGLLKAAGTSPSAPLSANGIRDAVLLVLNGHAEIRIKTRMEAYCKDCEKTTLRGERKFDASGDAECPKCGASLVGRPAITEMRPLA